MTWNSVITLKLACVADLDALEQAVPSGAWWLP